MIILVILKIAKILRLFNFAFFAQMREKLPELNFTGSKPAHSQQHKSVGKTRNIGGHRRCVL
jgi:hypothetical protein